MRPNGKERRPTWVAVEFLARRYVETKDQAAWFTLAAMVFAPVIAIFRAALMHCHVSRAEIEEAAEAFILQMHDNLGGWVPPKPFYPYMRQRAAWDAADRARKLRRERRILLDLARNRAIPGQAEEPAPSADFSMEEYALADQAANALSEQERRILFLKDVLGMSYEEICATEKMEREALLACRVSALKKFRDLLPKRLDAESKRRFAARLLLLLR